MSDFWPDLTAKVEPAHARALGVVAAAAAQVGVDWFLVGALARDWLLEAMHGVATQRKTADADVAIALPDWPAFERVKQGIVESGEFRAHPQTAHRLDHVALLGFHLDLVPFGAVAGDDATIAWPPAHAVVMNVIGYDDALAAAINLTVGDALSVKVASLPGLALLKLFAWQDRHTTTSKDAFDIRLLFTTYEAAGNGDRLYDEGVMDLEDFEADRAACRLLGRDVARLAAQSTRQKAGVLLESELLGESSDGLIEQLAYALPEGMPVIRSEADAGAKLEKARLWLTAFMAGLNDQGL
jgi:predicted nucleotidyltransferase